MFPCSVNMSAGSVDQEPTRKLGCCGVPVITEDMQALAIRSLSGGEVQKHYEFIRELGKGTYGRVELVSHKSTGKGNLRGERCTGRLMYTMHMQNWRCLGLLILVEQLQPSYSKDISCERC